LIDNPAYMEMQKQEEKKRNQEAAEALRIVEARREAQREADRLRREAEAKTAAIELENKERAELARLKNKYKG
jgi:hypothetical protein